jgi:hypothetical protein
MTATENCYGGEGRGANNCRKIMFHDVIDKNIDIMNRTVPRISWIRPLAISQARLSTFIMDKMVPLISWTLPLITYSKLFHRYQGKDCPVNILNENVLLIQRIEPFHLLYISLRLCAGKSTAKSTNKPSLSGLGIGIFCDNTIKETTTFSLIDDDSVYHKCLGHFDISWCANYIFFHNLNQAY